MGGEHEVARLISRLWRASWQSKHWLLETACDSCFCLMSSCPLLMSAARDLTWVVRCRLMSRRLAVQLYCRSSCQPQHFLQCHCSPCPSNTTNTYTQRSHYNCTHYTVIGSVTSPRSWPDPISALAMAETISWYNKQDTAYVMSVVLWSMQTVIEGICWSPGHF